MAVVFLCSLLYLHVLPYLVKFSDFIKMYLSNMDIWALDTAEKNDLLFLFHIQPF